MWILFDVWNILNDTSSKRDVAAKLEEGGLAIWEITLLNNAESSAQRTVLQGENGNTNEWVDRDLKELGSQWEDNLEIS